MPDTIYIDDFGANHFRYYLFQPHLTMLDL